MSNKTRAEELPIKVYLSGKEREKLQKLAKDSGHSMSAYMRQLLNFVIPKQCPGVDYQYFVWHLSKIGTNLNQIAKVANITGDILAEEYRANYRDFLKLSMEIQKAILEPVVIIHGSD